MVAPERLHEDLLRWGVVEPGSPIRFTKRFQGALARAASSLQAAEQAGAKLGDDPIGHQVEVALGAHLGPKGKEVGPEHRAFVRAVHLATLPEAVKKLLGL